MATWRLLKQEEFIELNKINRKRQVNLPKKKEAGNFKTIYILHTITIHMNMREKKTTTGKAVKVKRQTTTLRFDAC